MRMSEKDLLSQDEIDLLLMGGDGSSSAENKPEDKAKKMKPYDPANQHRVIRERLHALDMINERFARSFRANLFGLLRRTADITVIGMTQMSFQDFTRSIPVPANLNIINMKPLRGAALVVFPPSLVYLVVDILYGGDGQFETRVEGREFTPAVQEIIRRLVDQSLESYKESWKSIYPINPEYVRSEMQARFASVTNSPNEMVISTEFSIEINNFSSKFHIALPYAMIEPIRRQLNGPLSDSYPEDESVWSNKMKSELEETEVEVNVDFSHIHMTLGDIMKLSVNDILPIEMPKEVDAKVQGVSVMKCDYGSMPNGSKAIRVKRVLDHTPLSYKS